MLLSSVSKFYKPAAAELFSSAKCNLDCTYCHILKNSPAIDQMHEDVIKKIQEVDPIIDRLYDLYGEDLEYFTHWGTEPSLTIKYFKPFYRKALSKFPKLKQIGFSSNFLSHTNALINFVEHFPKIDDRKIELHVQFSLDGPKWVTDENRKIGATETIIKNMVKFVEGVNNIENVPFTVVHCHFKPTMSRTQFPKMLEDGEILKYYEFFDEVFERIESVNTKHAMFFSRNVDPTIVCPDEYTQLDGICFHELYEKTLEFQQNTRFKYISPGSNYYQAFYGLLLLSPQYFSKPSMFTCSAGDSQFGFSDYLHPCHATFFLNNEKLQEETLQQGKNNRTQSIKNVDSIVSGRSKMAEKNLTIKFDELTDKKLTEYLYFMRSFHDFPKNRLSLSVAMIKLLAKAGQVSKCYKETEMAEVLAFFCNSRHSCNVDAQMFLGSMQLNFNSYFKLFGNGMVESFLKRYITERKIN